MSIIHLQMIRKFALRDMIVILKRKKKFEIQINKIDVANDINDEYVLINDFHIKTIELSKSQKQTISLYIRNFEWQ